MSEMATLKLRVDSSEVLNAGQHLKKLNSQAKESASVGKRLEMMWNGYFSTAAGLEAQLARAMGASNSAMQQQQNMYQEANARVKELVSNQQAVARGLENIERKAKDTSSVLKGIMESASAWIDPKEVISKLGADKFKRQDISMVDQTLKRLPNLLGLLPGIGHALSVFQSLPLGAQDHDQFDQYFNNIAVRIVKLQDMINDYSSAQKKNSDKDLFKKIGIYSDESVDLVELIIDKYAYNIRQIRYIEDDIQPNLIGDKARQEEWESKPYNQRPEFLAQVTSDTKDMTEQEWKYKQKRKYQPSENDERLLEKMIALFKFNTQLVKQFGDIGDTDSASKLEDAKQNILSWTKEVARVGYGNITDETVDKLIRIQTAVIDTKDDVRELSNEWPKVGHAVQDSSKDIIELRDDMLNGWDEGYKNPFEGMQEDTQELGIEIYGLGDAAQASSQDFVKANEANKKSQIDLSKAITLETKDAIDESRDYQFKYYDGLYDESKDYFDFRIDLAEQETQIVEEQTGEQTRLVQQATQEQARIQESGTVSMLKSWSDMTQGWDQIAMNALDGIQQTLQQTFYNAFSGVGDAWDNLWDGMKNIAYQVLASIATKMATGLIANIGLNFIGGASGGGVGATASGAGSLMNMASMGSSAYNMFGSGGLSSFGTYGGMGSSLFTYGTEAGIMSPSIGGFAAAPQGAALSGLGYGVAGIGGAIAGYNLSYQLYGKNTGAQVGGTLGGAGGAMLGAQIGMAGGPVGALIGAIIGGLIGGAAGGGIGSIFGGGEPDTEDREADAERSYKIMRDLNKQANLDEDVDVDKYLEAINAGHRSDNRVNPEAMWALYNNLKSKNKLPWWAGNPDQIAHTRQLKGGTEWGQEQWSRYRLYGKGGRDADNETGDSGMAQWFGKEGNGPWGGEGNWEKVKGALDEMDIETLDRLGESLFNVKEGAAAFGVDMAELMGKFDLAQLESGEWATILKDELSPASLMAAMNDQLRAEGMNNLEIAAQKQAAAIDSLLGTFNMGEEDTDAWMEQLFKANAEQEDLSKKMAEYQDIVEQLKHVKAGEEEKTKDLITRGRELREELGLGESAFSKIEKGFEDFVKAMEDIAKRLLDAANGNPPNKHHGGLIYHSGGLVGAMLHAGMITAHGGSPRMHSGGLRPDERMTILQAGEFVVQRSSVNAKTLEALRNINATGRLPVDMLSRAMDQIGNTPKFHSGGPVTPLPAMASTTRPQGGDGGQAVVINFNPQITVNAENGADAAKIEAAVNKALEKSRVALKRQLEQTGYQVVDAQ